LLGKQVGDVTARSEQSCVTMVSVFGGNVRFGISTEYPNAPAPEAINAVAAASVAIDLKVN